MIFALLFTLQVVAPPAAPAPPASRRVAVTFDDLPVVTQSPDDSVRARITRDLLAALVRRRVPITGFVNEGKLYDHGTLDTARVRLLEQWIAAGEDLGNHTYGHIDMNVTALADFERDVLAGERITRPLLARAGRRLRYFRHPYLQTGNDAKKREQFETFLKRHGYVIAPVTIDNSDWMFAHAYELALLRADTQVAHAIQQSYFAYMDTVVGFYERQSQLIVGREIPQILLLHANALNAASFDSVAGIFRRRGYLFLTLAQALADPAYHQPDRYNGPDGITWLHRWAIGAGMPASTFAGEPEVPKLVAEFK